VSNSIPLLSAGALFPALHWLETNGHSLGAILARADLPSDLADRPMLAIPYHAAANLLGEAFAFAGPDGGCRMAQHAHFDRMGVLGQLRQGARSAGEALWRLTNKFAAHSSHELLRVEGDGDGLRCHSFINLRTAPLQTHERQQYTLALVAAFAAAGPNDGLQVMLAPHPTVGVSHLLPWFGTEVAAARGREAWIRLPRPVLERPLPDMLAAASPRPDLRPMGGDSLTRSAQVLLAGLLGDGVLDIGRLARLTGRSQRSLQRQFLAEGTSFSEVLDGVRRDRALELRAQGRRMTDIVDELGYANASVLSHAMRRWARMGNGARPARAGRGPG
jgi:AraC-like DNA-binding protein